MRTRLAPSPTGALHLGNARTFLVNWALARQRDWEIVLRIEDLDGPRIKQGADAAAIETLRWLGVDWDEGPYYQRLDLTPYEGALNTLAAAGQIYRCRCTRKEIEQASLSAPHDDQHELRYPGTCRPATAEPTSFVQSDDGEFAWRVRALAGPSEFVDAFVGRHVGDVAATTGDFLVATKQGLPSYQLAVVVDDARQGIDCVVRGDDLLDSTHRQLHLQQLLGLEPPRHYWHLPLVVGEDGRRLAKRHGDTRISYYRDAGTASERIIGLLAEWCGLGSRRRLTAAEFGEQFDLRRLSQEQIVFTEDDDAWLRG